jgi:hypothetical protein
LPQLRRSRAEFLGAAIREIFFEPFSISFYDLRDNVGVEILVAKQFKRC